MLKLGLIFAIIQPNISSPVLTKIAKIHVIWFADSCASSFCILGQRRSCFFLLFSSFDHCLDHALLAVMLCLLWITKSLWLEGTSGHHPCQAPCTKTGSPRTSCSRQLSTRVLNISKYGDSIHIHYSVQHQDFKWKPRQFSFLYHIQNVFFL